MSTETAPILSTRGVVKRFGSVTALDGVDFDIRAGEVVGIVGDNGAGKSTFARMLGGIHAPDEGEVMVDGVPVHFRGPQDARRAGIETVHQHLALAENIDATGNFYLGRELRLVPWLGWVSPLDNRQMRSRTKDELDRLRIHVPRVWGAPTERFSGGQRQAIAVMRSAYWARRVLIMDEPTAALGVRESSKVLDVVRAVRDAGVAVVIISHILPHVIELCDRALVMRHGHGIAQIDTKQVSSDELVKMIVGVEEGSPAS